MEEAGPHSVEIDQETKDLQGLLDAFSSVCSLEEIASAYTTANGNVDDAGGILCQLQNSRSSGLNVNNSSSKTDACLQPKKCRNEVTDFHSADRVGRLKPKKMSVSMGLVSDVLRKGSSRSYQPLDMPSEYIKLSGSEYKTSKIIKLSEPKDKLSDKKDDAIVLEVLAKNQPLSNQDMEEFLFTMLRDGFNLDKENIQGVLRSCRYDMKKSMDELLDMSPLNPFKINERSSNCCTQFTDEVAEVKLHTSEDYTALGSLHKQTSQNSLLDVTDTCSLEQQSDVLNEVLEALFKDSNRLEEPKKTRRQIGLHRKVVFSALVDENAHQDDNGKPSIFRPVALKENTYEALERAVKQHWDMMKAYYESAVDAVSKGDHDRANYLKDQGNYYASKTREAERKCCEEISKMRSKDEVKLELDIFNAKEAVHLLKKNLRLLAGIPSLPLKVVINSDKEDETKGKRRQRVLKFLERSSIVWTTAEGQEGTILIEVDQLDPENLSFARNESEG